MSKDSNKHSLGYPPLCNYEPLNTIGVGTGCLFIYFVNVLESRLLNLVRYWDGKCVGWCIFRTKGPFTNGPRRLASRCILSIFNVSFSSVVISVSSSLHLFS